MPALFMLVMTNGSQFIALHIYIVSETLGRFASEIYIHLAENAKLAKRTSEHHHGPAKQNLRAHELRRRCAQLRLKAVLAAFQYVSRPDSEVLHEEPSPTQLDRYSLNQSSALSVVAAERAVEQES